MFQRRYRMKYSESEEVETIAEIRHPILRETLTRHWRGNPLEIASSPTCPPEPEWAPPGAFTGRLIKGLAHARRTSATPGAIAESASEIEIDVLKENCGKQDPYVAAHGGICAYTFNQDGTVDVEPLELSDATLRALREHMLLFYTGERARVARPCWPTRTSGPAAATRRCSRTSIARRRWATAAGSCCSTATCSRTRS